MESVKQSKFSKSTLLKRALCYMLTTVMVLSGFGMIPGTRLVANAASVMTKADLPTTAGSTLSDGKIYYVNSDTTITNSSAGGNGLIVENNATVAIHIAKGVTLTVKGGNGNGQTAGGAGIYVPATSTLIVVGEGTLNATGGNGGNGGNGEAGTDAVRTNNAYNCTTGTGGKGGYGAGGAGAAIGTAGGAGANQPTAQSSQNYRGNWFAGAGGNAGLKGENSNVSGNVYILGSVKFDGTAGSAGSAGTDPGASGTPERFQYSSYYVHVGAGGGGGTGGATKDAATIGSGAPGAGSGGNGGNGGAAAYNAFGNRCSNGYGGNGGSVGGRNGVRSNTYSYPYDSGAGGAAGAIGASGDAGTLYVGPNANVGTLNSETATGENGYGKSSALTTLTSEEQYQILSDNDLIFEKQISFYNLDESANPDSIVTATVYGEAVSNIVIPSKNGYSFAGFYTEKNGKGIKIYDAKGKIATDEDGNIADSDSTLYVSDGYWVYPDNLSLYAYWTQKYNVTLNGNVGTDEEPLSIVGTTSIAIAGGEKVNSITLPTRKSYIFEGYFSAKDSSDDEAVKVFSADGSPYPGTTFIDKDGCWVYEAEATDVTLYASWLPVTTITFDKNASDATAGTTSVVVAKGEAVADIIVPTRSGWLFDGYNIENTSTKLFDKTGSIIKSVANYTDANGKWISTANVTLKAIWTKTDGEVTFSNEIEQDYFEKVATTPVTTYNNVPEVKNITADSEVIAITAFDAANAPTRTGYTFTGFADELSGGTVVFDADGKIADKNITSKLNGKIVENGKWVYRGTITLYAQWTPVNYNFTFDKNTGDGNDVTLNNVDISNGYPATVTVAKQSKPGQQLLGFAATKDATADNLIYKASADDITIFNYVSGSVTTRPENLDITLYAVWGTSTYQVAYYDRDWSTVAVDNASVNNIGTTKIGELQNMTYGEFMLKSLKEANNDKEYSPKFSGDENVTDYYAFAGWSTEPYAKTADYEAGKQYQGGLTTTAGEIVKLYAVWVKLNGADISFNGNGSLDAPATNIPADDEVIFDKKDKDGKAYAEYMIESKYQPVREGYKFLGWSKSATDSENLLIPGTDGVKVNIYEDTVFYAQWKINPQVSYDANGGILNDTVDGEGNKLSDLLKAKRYPAGTANLPVVNPRESKTGETVTREALISRTGYTFAGWTVTAKDKTIYSDDKIYSSGDNGNTNPTLTAMPDTDIVFKAKWIKNTYSENIIADHGNDVYEVSYTGTYNKDGTLTRLDEKPVTDTSDEVPTNVTLTKSEVVGSNDYIGKTGNIPHGASVVLKVVVNGNYNAENVVVKVNNAIYKPATTSVETVAETVVEDKQGKTTFTYRIDDVTNAKDFDVTIAGAIKKSYKVQYELLNSETKLAENSPEGYNANEEVSLLNPVDKENAVNNYTFNGWYDSKEKAELGKDTDKITKVATNQRGNKTYYAGWVGKNYTVTFDKLYGTKGGKDVQTATQQLTFGKEEALSTINALFDDTTEGNDNKGAIKGPNGVAFLGWATSEENALAHKVAYTDGQSVQDIAKSSAATDAVTLWAVWDIEKVTISFNANGGAFGDGNIAKTKSFDYHTTAEAAVADMSVLGVYPSREGYTFKGWSKDKTATDENGKVATNIEVNADDTYYAIWNPESRTFQYFKTKSGGENPTSITTLYGSEIYIGKKQEGDELVDVDVTNPDNKPIIGWTKGSYIDDADIVYAHGEKVVVTKNTDLYPVFGDGSTHTLAYSANGGTFANSPKPETMTETSEGVFSKTTITVEPTRKGYTFEGWSEKATNPVANEIISAGEEYTYNVPTQDIVYSHVLYAVWKPVQYTVTFMANKAPDVTNEYINFADANATTYIPKLIEEDKRSKDITVNGTGDSYSQTFDYDTEKNFAELQYEYPGFVFKGWSETATGDVIYKNAQSVLNMTDSYNADGSKKNFTLYAIWAMDTPLTVTYRANGGDLKKVTPAATTENPNPEAVETDAPKDQKYVRIADTMNIATAENVYVRDGYKFLGWSQVASVLAADATAEQIAAAKIISGTEYGLKDVSKTTSVTLYAVWQKLPAYRVIYNLNAGAGSVPVDTNSYHIDTDTYLDDKVAVHNEVTLDASVVPTRTGYTFLGWSTDEKYKKSADNQNVDNQNTDGQSKPFFAEYTPAKEAEGENPEVPAKLDPEKLKIDADTYGSKANNTINLYAIWEENTYKINFFKVDKKDPANETKQVKIGEQEFAYDYAEGKLTAVDKMSFTPKVEEGQESVTNKYEATPGYEFAGWSFKAGGTLSLDDEAPIVNVLTGASDDTKEMNLYVVEKEKILTVTIKDDFETIGKNFIDDADTFKDIDDKSFSEFYEKGWGKVDVNIKDRDADDKVVKIEEGKEGYATASDLDKTGIDNSNHKYLVKYTKALNDITVPKAPGFIFEGYYGKVTVPDTSEGVQEGATKEVDVMYYDASGNAVKNADFTDDIELKAKWEAITFDVIFTENGDKLQKESVTYGQAFKMPNTVKDLDYNPDLEVVGWTTSVDNQKPETAAIDGMKEYTSPDKFELNKSYSAIVIAKLYNNYNADITMYPIYKTTRKYKVYFSTVDQTKVTNLPETQEVAWNDTFFVKFDDTVMRTPRREGYTFLGWSKTEDSATAEYPYKNAEGKVLTHEIDKVQDTFTLYAVWQANTYKVEYYNAANKVVEDEVTYPFNVLSEAYALRTADDKNAEDKPYFVGKDGYTLAGWSLDAKAETVDFAPGQKLDKALATGADGNDTVKVYAVWVAGDYKVKFDKNLETATGTMEDQAMTYDKFAALNINLYKADGYEFAGWALAKVNGEETIIPSEAGYADGQNVDLTDKVGANTEITLYAIWTPVIKTTDKTVKYADAGWDVSEMFTIPAKAGEAKYTLTKAEGAKLAEDGKTLTVAKSGTYEITVDTAAAEGITVSTAKAEITVEKADAVGTVKTYNGEAYSAETETDSFVEAKDEVKAQVVFTSPTDENYKPEIAFTYKVAGTSDETYSDEVPTKAGKYTVRAIVEDTDKYAGFTKTANFEITSKIKTEATVAIYNGDATESTTVIPYEDAAKLTPKVDITTGDKNAAVKYEYKAQDAGDGTYTEVKPTAEGKYTVRATIADTDKYLGTEVTANFEISNKLQAAGEVKTFDGDKETVEFMEAENLVITPKVIFTTPETAEEADKLIVTYTYKVATASDSTYSDKQPMEVGEYTVRAIVADSAKYSGFTKTANFKITEDPDKAEAAAKKAAVEKADADTSKRLQDTYETLKNSNNYSDGQLAALEAAYNTAKADLETAVTDTIANDSEITSAGVPAAAEAALATAKSALLDAVKSTAENEAAAKAVADVKANAEAALAAAEDALKNENAIQEDKDAITKAKSDVETAKAAVEGLAEDASNDDKEAAAKALQDAVDALDTAVDTSNLHAAIAEAVMNQENIQPFVKKVATDSLEEYAERIKPDDLNEAEAKDYNDAIAEAKKAIEEAANNEEVLSTLAAVKEDIKAAATEINDTRAANAAKEAAEAAAATAETLADEAKANEYASEADKKAIDDAKNTLDDAKEALAAAETNEAKNEAAKAVNDAVKTLQDATDTANTNSADAKKAADEAAAAKAAAEDAATTAETLAEEAKANEYASEADKKAIDDAKKSLDDAKEALAAAETNDAINEAASAVNEAAKALQDATDKANANSATAKKTAEDLAAAKKEAKDRLEDVYDAKNKDDYRADQQKALADAKNAGDKAIDAATTSDEVAKALTDAKAAINAVKTDSKLTKEEKDAADAKAAKDATDKINAIGKVTTDSKGAIDAARNAYNALTADQKKLVPANVVTILTTAEKTYQTLAAKATEEAKKKAAEEAAKKAAEEAAKQPKINPDKETFFTLFLHASKVTKNSITLSWTKVDGATKYIVYGGRYGAKAKKITGTSGTKSTRSKLSAGKFYRYYVVAYNAKGEKICTSAKVYVVTKGGKYTNYKSISTKAAGNKVNLATGETFNIGAKVKKSDSKLTLKKIHGLKYASTNPKIAKVDKKGKITAVSKGTCYVYVYAQNGVYKKIKVTVE